MYAKNIKIKNNRENYVENKFSEENIFNNSICDNSSEDPLAFTPEIDNKTIKPSILCDAELFKVKKNGDVVKVNDMKNSLKSRRKRLKQAKRKPPKKDTPKKLTSLERLMAQIDAQLIAKGQPVPEDIPNPISDIKLNKIENNPKSITSEEIYDSDFSWPYEKHCKNHHTEALIHKVPSDSNNDGASKKILLSFKLFENYEHFLKSYQHYLKLKPASYLYDGDKLKSNRTNDNCEDFVYVQNNLKPIQKKHIDHKNNTKLSLNKCNVCNIDCRHTVNLLRHVYFIHNIAILTKNSFVSDLNVDEVANDRVTVTIQTGEHLDLYKCCKCPKMFAVQKSLADHKRRVHSKSHVDDLKYPFRCKTCDTAYKRSNDYMRHVKHYHKTIARTKLDSDPSKRQMLQDFLDDALYFKDGSFACDFCDRKPSSVSLFRKHLKDDHRMVNADGSFPYSCQRCQKVFVADTHLIKHALQVHGVDMKTLCLDTDKRFFCDMCPKKFVFKQSLQRHIESAHLKEVNSRCELFCKDGCNKIFSTKLQLKKHTSLYDQFRCNVCNKHFYSQNMLDKHQIIHTNSRQYTCPVCAKAYMHRHHLMQHELIHGDRTHLCPHCPTAFFTRSQLNSHSKIHSNEKPFECKFCSKSFKRRQTLCDHEKLHTGEKSSFACSLCKKKFRSDSALQNHTKKHKKESAIKQ
ncbi:uncharacterized protein LOC143909989 [Arctopsyche grandis]|uniref:uncharacterized protein LOC143909989 n=1 Tax=Arctopsyche grandis TaxID=121162 RepID=UPI00406D96D3